MKTISKCYCVKCGRIWPISFFYILQGSAATHLKCGGRCGISFIASFLENTTMETVWETVNAFVKVMNERYILAKFFLTHCVLLLFLDCWQCHETRRMLASTTAFTALNDKCEFW